MSPRMTTQSVGRPAAASRGGGTGGRACRGGGRNVSRSGDQGNGRIDGQGGQVGGQGDQGRGQGNGRNQNGDAINDNIWGDVRNVIENNDRKGCTYKEFLACNPKESRGGCRADHVAYTDRFHELDRLLAHLTDEALRNGSIKKNPEKRGNGGEPSKDRNGRDDNKRTRTGNAFATTVNPVRREYTSTTPKCTACNYHHSPETPCHTCFNSNCPGHFSKDYRVVPRNVNPINARNPTARAYYKCVVAINGGQGRGNNGNQARGREFMLGVEEVRQDPNIMTGTFTLNNHYATTLFDSGADYSFVSTTFIPRLGIEPSDLGLSYEIEKASGQLVEIDKVSKGCKLEIEGHVFDINLIPFGSGSFDVIIGMDWLANHKDEIISHEKVVRIPLPDGKVLRVIRERPDEKVRLIMSVKAKEQKQEEIVVVRDFPEVFPDDLSGLPPN
ncbi:putative reverse transcriptase domain-containing protein [Tanacetum coccineum]